MTHTPLTLKDAQRGFTLIELMVALMLGLLVVAAAGGLFLSNRRVYGTTASINRIQENQRIAFELLARDIREAGGNPCTRNIVNMLDTSKPGGSYFAGWSNGVSGNNGTGPNGSDEITLSLANGASITVTESDNPSAELGLSSVGDITTGDILMVCNAEVASIFQVTNVASGKVGHNAGTGNPGNLEKPFQIDQATFDSNTAAQTGYCFLPPATGANPNCLNPPSGSPAQVVTPFAVRWYVANNTRGGTSLYRQVVTNGGAAPETPAEIAEGVTNMQISYKIGTDPAYLDAAAGLAWKQVMAVHAQLTFHAVRGALTKGDVLGTDNAVLTRSLDDYILLRNHQDIQ
ncbi:type IV pilus assembly protein PilW [Pseudoxanthomonas spadix BD-a59]|uniref:Type IV pilus assembly protein PilW n=1 Tax=Pseudoxanthomonas spadix (strain BD-a59) TaxID=1045855 RepID=G7URB1_PSEUP|nr:prepilin-type N-terminal cleavage/methylation domain-containing protein [Pseudoxanthomonas spadix]AER57103.1 type IV pilus assembly protein PilW [Pseudoxanthomonas spadix BD-a59]